MASLNKSLYDELFKVYKALYPCKIHSNLDKEVSQLWKALQNGNKVEFHTRVRLEITKLHNESLSKKANLLNYWAKLPKSQTETPKVTVASLEPESSPSPILNYSESESTKIHKTPAQDQLKQEILAYTQDIQHLEAKKTSGLATDKQLEDLSKLKLKIKERQQKLLKAEGDRQRQQRKRDKEKLILDELEESHPEVVSKLKRRKVPGRPRLEDIQSGLLEAILIIAVHSSGADERRRSDRIRSVRTLDQLTEELRLQGYNLSRSGVYLRLLPPNSRTIEGKKHIKTVPVKLVKASNDFHKAHVDTEFCKAGISYLEELASILGPNDVIFLSQDDKARVPLGITAANKQSPILMHMDYRIKLPDHDWVVAERHKLIPSVYALMKIEPNKIGDRKAVGYTGPTHVSIRSAKHNSSTAVSHGEDLDYILTNDKYTDFCKIIITDGGPDENPRYHKVMEVAIAHFKKYNLDGVFLATNAPGRSAYNRVERRMAPLSRELAGLILPYDNFGSHLDENHRTVDEKLEKANFEHAGNILVNIWSNMTFDGYETTCHYVGNIADREVQESPAEWKSRHVREGHYFFQVVKCKNRSCCSEPRSSIFKIIDQFIPAPICVTQADNLNPHANINGKNDFCSLLFRLRLDDTALRKNGFELPFDLCCPSLKDLLEPRTCGSCGNYHSSIRTLKAHKKICRLQNQSAPTVTLSSILGDTGRQRPLRAAARRQHEKMVVWTSRLNSNHADWFDDEDLQDSDVQDSLNPDHVDIPVIDFNEYNTNPWENL